MYDSDGIKKAMYCMYVDIYLFIYLFIFTWAAKREKKMCCPNKTWGEDHILSTIFAEIHGKSCSCEYMAQINFLRDNKVNVIIKEKEDFEWVSIVKNSQVPSVPQPILWCTDMNATWSARQMRLKITEDKNIPHLISNLNLQKQQCV